MRACWWFLNTSLFACGSVRATPDASVVEQSSDAGVTEKLFGLTEDGYLIQLAATNGSYTATPISARRFTKLDSHGACAIRESGGIDCVEYYSGAIVTHWPRDRFTDVAANRNYGATGCRTSFDRRSWLSTR